MRKRNRKRDGMALALMAVLILGSWTLVREKLLANPTIEKADALSAFFPDDTCTLDFRDAEVKNILRALAAAYSVNILVMENVSGVVTASFRDVQVKDVFITVLKSAGLDYLIQGNIIWVDTFRELQKKRKNAPLVTRILEIKYSFDSTKNKDLSKLSKELKKLNSRRQGANISVLSRTNTLIITDIEENVDKIVEMAGRLDKKSRQIAIMAKMVQINTNYSKDLGLKWGGEWSTGRKIGEQTAGSAPGSFIVGGAAGETGDPVEKNWIVDLAGSNPAAVLDLVIGKVGNDVLQVQLAALESEGYGKILASPKVITQDNQAANIESGFEIPYQIQEEAGKFSIQLKRATIGLRATPHVVGKNLVFMDLNIKQDKPVGPPAMGVPLSTQTLTTKVLVKSGETVIIGGLISQDTTDSETKVPLLGDIPILGWLFKSTGKKTEEVELFIFVTPTILEDPLEEAETKISGL